MGQEADSSLENKIGDRSSIPNLETHELIYTLLEVTREGFELVAKLIIVVWMGHSISFLMR
ncbi:hypothetical protein SAMN05216566_1592 [Aureimonas phyllosphaerae]|nr:hypothetical protein SAMN05216566_1592 [Aureimonas phyllosphaerae]